MFSNIIYHTKNLGNWYWNWWVQAFIKSAWTMKFKCGRFHVIYTPLSHVTGLINRLAGIGRVQSTEDWPSEIYCFTPDNGSRLSGTATSGLEGRVPQLQIKLLTQLQKAFCFGYFPGYFRDFFLFSCACTVVQAHEEECQTSGFVGKENLWFLRVTQWNLPAISRRFTQ